MSKKKINIALAGNANVGKSVIFNHLTGLHQHIGNWPGKTIEKAEGSLYYQDYLIDVIDLPGIYSLSTYSIEEIISREYIIYQKPDFIINIVDATNLERNLIFTLQLLELEKPVVMALNMVNLLGEKGITIDIENIENILNIPIVPVAAIYGKGLTEVLDQGIILTNDKNQKPTLPKYGKEVEERITQLVDLIPNIDLTYPKKFIAIKLLEKDIEIKKLLKEKKAEKVLEKTVALNLELEKIHGHDSSIVIADERCNYAAKIARGAIQVTKPKKMSFNELFDNFTSHGIFGYLAMMVILGVSFFAVLKFGNYTSSLIESLISNWHLYFQNIFGNSIVSLLVWSGLNSFLVLLAIVLPYVAPFYFALFFLESWGYLARVSYLMDNLMHKLGVHGKACIPMMLGLGCNVTACLSCRIMETQRERVITGFLSTFVPCSAVSVIVAGLAGKFLGTMWIFILYFFVALIIIGIGKLSIMIIPGEITDLIMEMPSYKKPNFKAISFHTWAKLKELLWEVGPIVVVLGVLIDIIKTENLLPYINHVLSPITVTWLGLPASVGALLIFGILRKELILILLATILGTTNFSLALTHLQMFILSLVSMLYIPCLATILALKKEFGWQKAFLISAFKIIFAILLSGIIMRLLALINVFK